MAHIASKLIFWSSAQCLRSRLSKNKETNPQYFYPILTDQVAPKGIRVNSVNPGVIVTGIFEKAGLTSAQAADYYESCKALHPLGRPGTADEVATAIAFLASKVILKMTLTMMSMHGPCYCK